MQAEEIGLRMHGVTGVGAAQASQMIRQMVAVGGDPYRLLRSLGLNERQQAQFRQVDSRYLAATLTWLEQPDSVLLTYGEAGYPE